MEYALWELLTPQKETTLTRLNPCCSGICSLSQIYLNIKIRLSCLNPCCSGICSLRVKWFYCSNRRNGLNPCCSGICSLRMLTQTIEGLWKRVLILVVVEYALWDLQSPYCGYIHCLNPCCSGICSLSSQWWLIAYYYEVLILVVVEYALWEWTSEQ